VIKSSPSNPVAAAPLAAPLVRKGLPRQGSLSQCQHAASQSRADAAGFTPRFALSRLDDFGAAIASPKPGARHAMTKNGLARWR